MSFLFVLIGVAEFSLGETLLMGCLGMLVQCVFQAKTAPQAGAGRVQRRQHGLLDPGCVRGLSSAFAALQSALILSAAAFFVANTLSIAIVIALTEDKNVWQVWRDSYFWTFPNYLVGAAVAWVRDAWPSAWWDGKRACCCCRSSTWSTAHTVLYVHGWKKRQETGRGAARRMPKKWRRLHRRTIETLALAIEAKDQTTHDHLERVEIYAIEVGKELGLTRIRAGGSCAPRRCCTTSARSRCRNTSSRSPGN